MKKNISLTFGSEIELPKDVQFGLHDHLLSEMSLSRNVNLKTMYSFNKKVKLKCNITNQHSSGRCWLFAGLNMIRNQYIEKEKLSKDFEFSQSYLFFWDKLERINFFINLFIETKELNLDSRKMQFLLKEPLGDGGQWQMFVNLIDKYGLVPKDVYPESKHSCNSRGLNMVLTKKLREYCEKIRTNDESFNKADALKECYILLVRFLGEPPKQFDWEFVNSDKKQVKYLDMKPQDFYNNVVNVDLNNYVSIVNDPRNEYEKLFGVENLGNIEEGKEVKYLNLEMKVIKDMVKKSLDENEPVWFGSDVGQYLHSKSNIMDRKVFNMEEYLGINFSQNKRNRIEYGESLMTHAMVITGYNEDRYGQIDRWEIENSWGSKGPNSGYYVMTTDWMNEFVYQVVINKKYLSDDVKRLWGGEIDKRFPPWDPMGALA